MNREPAIVSGITTAVAAFLALAVAFGLDLTPDQTAAITATVAVLAPVAAALIARHFVTPVRGQHEAE